MQITKHGFQWKAVFLSKRDDEAVVRRRRLQFEIERDAEALAEREPPGLIDSPAKSRLAAKLATTTPITTGHRTVGPNATRKPEATPAAGQNTATPSALSSKARLRRAARKKTIATEIEMAHGGHARCERAGRASLVATSELIVCSPVMAYAIYLELS